MITIGYLLRPMFLQVACITTKPQKGQMHRSVVGSVSRYDWQHQTLSSPTSPRVGNPTCKALEPSQTTRKNTNNAATNPVNNMQNCKTLENQHKTANHKLYTNPRKNTTKSKSTPGALWYPLKVLPLLKVPRTLWEYMSALPDQGASRTSATPLASLPALNP